MKRSALGLTQKLGWRLGFLMAATLLPLGIIAYTQTFNLKQEAQARTEAALTGATLRAASAELDAIRRAQGLVAGLAPAMPRLVEDVPGCISALNSAADFVREASIVAFVPASGLMVCSSSGATYDYSREPLFQAERGKLEPSFVVVPRGPVSGTTVLGVLHPVISSDGRYLGYVSVWMPQNEMDGVEKIFNLPGGSQDPLPVSLWTFDASGGVLTASEGRDRIDSRLPLNRNLADLATPGSKLFRDMSMGGEMLTYSVVPVEEGRLFVMGSWNQSSQSTLRDFGISPTFFPLMMWVVGLIVAVWASELLVLRHIRTLNRSIRRFAAGDRHRQEIDMRGAPVELREMAEAYLSMTDSITQDEAKLEDSIHQKEVLLREVHHRVKNNLQLIASIMNMQMRQSRTPEAKFLLKGLQDRVMSLATIHRGLYQTSGLVDVRADELLADIVRQIMKFGGGTSRTLEVEQDYDDIRLPPDQAVPLSLLLTEAMTNALKYVGRPDAHINPMIRVRLKRIKGDQAVLEVLNTVGDQKSRPPEVMLTSTGLGSQLLVAFSQQIGGTLQQQEEEDHYRLSVTFSPKPLDVADTAEDGDEETDNPTGQEG
ncbi:sensor histidine kinase [Szabonella alba]|uniref:histidine kinase n=1 Tax=Szabonella alba TaxID=2804194 RepID=A0A8K0XZ56_9RHOB|nr:sensor histidine kinase [Szabonella alba]MBL4915723.1 sensor histidine kinase [Szabonella alba]